MSKYNIQGDQPLSPTINIRTEQCFTHFENDFRSRRQLMCKLKSFLENKLLLIDTSFQIIWMEHLENHIYERERRGIQFFVAFINWSSALVGKSSSVTERVNDYSILEILACIHFSETNSKAIIFLGAWIWMNTSIRLGEIQEPWIFICIFTSSDRGGNADVFNILFLELSSEKGVEE